MKLDGMPTENVPVLARAIEQGGLDEVWICEDLYLNGGIAQSAIALAVTERVRVGHGIAPAAVRNVAYYAMEVASLCRTYPGRFIPGLGHGMPNWLKQVGAHPGRLLPCLEEVCDVTQRLLTGETVTFNGEYVHIEDVFLRFPPADPPKLALGVRGPRGVDVAARVAGGLILAEGSGPEYVKRAVEQVGPGKRNTVFTWFSIDSTTSAAHDRIRPNVQEALGQDFMQSQLGHLGAGEATNEVIEAVAVSGDAEQCAAAINALYAAGADAVVLQPVHGTEEEQLARVSADLLPLLGR
jgi:5,10-methylenetetrahydromethanopterin reductase